MLWCWEGGGNRPVRRADNLILKSGSLNLLEPSRPVQACTGIALPLYDTSEFGCTFRPFIKWLLLANLITKQCVSKIAKQSAAPYGPSNKHYPASKSQLNPRLLATSLDKCRRSVSMTVCSML
jgi:hypothetical protein